MPNKTPVLSNGSKNQGLDVAINERVSAAINSVPEHLGQEIDKTLNAALTSAVDSYTARATTSQISRALNPSVPAKLFVQRQYQTDTLAPNAEFQRQLNDPTSEIGQLLLKPVMLRDDATRKMDGRNIAMVIVIVRDKKGATQAGIKVSLRNDRAELVDHARVNPNGIALLKFPMSAESMNMGAQSSANALTRGTVELSDGSLKTDVTVDLSVQQYTIAELIADALPAIVTESLTWDNPFDRIPVDFTTKFCHDAMGGILQSSFLTGDSTKDPILGNLTGAGDFRASRTPIVKRLEIHRVGKQRTIRNINGQVIVLPPRRYLFRVRQEWKFLNYTLGELAGVTGLDPGAVAQDITNTVRNATQTLDNLSSLDQIEVRSALSQLSSVDTLVKVAVDTATGASVGGALPDAAIGMAAAGPLGAIIGAIIGGPSAVNSGVSATTNTSTSSSLDTALYVNNLLHSAKSVVNQALRTVMSAVSNLQSVVSHVSPLLARTTNLLRWVLYENYVVCTYIEDVHEILPQKIWESPDPKHLGTWFTPEDIVEYRRYFEPALLEPRLRPHFDLLSQWVNQENQSLWGGGIPVTQVHFAVHYAASGMSSDFTISVGDQALTVKLLPGSTLARGVLAIPPTLPSDLTSAEVVLAAQMQNSETGFATLPPNAVTKVSKLELWWTKPAAGANITAPFSSLQVNGSKLVDDAVLNLTVKNLPLQAPDNDDLFRHINLHNWTYYFGVLIQAAYAVPSLRDTAPQLAAYNYDNPIWQLPIYGFEADRILLIKDIDLTTKDGEEAKSLFDGSAATIIQLASPGAYAEALKGVLELVPIDPTKTVGELIHPALLPPPPPVAQPVEFIDLTQKLVPLLAGGALGGNVAGGGIAPGGLNLPAGTVLGVGGAQLPNGGLIAAGALANATFLPPGSLLIGGAQLPNNGTFLGPGTKIE